MTPRALVVLLLIVSCKKTSPPPEPAPPVDRPAAQPAPSPAPPKPTLPVAPPKALWGEPVEIATRDEVTDIGLQLDDARKYVEARDADLAAYRIEMRYVRSDGTLDPTYGNLVVYFGVPQNTEVPVDDPSRPTGAPVPEVRAVKPRPSGTPCPQLTFHVAEGWKSPRYFCVSHDRIVGPRCSAKTIWERAIGKGAPKDALAILEIQGADARYNLPQQWRFRITDTPRKVDIRHTFPDNCETAVEK